MTDLRARLTTKPKDEVLYFSVLSIALDKGGKFWPRPRFEAWRKDHLGLIIRIGWRWTAVVVSIGGLMRMDKEPVDKAGKPNV